MMETDLHGNYFFSESDESDIDVGPILLDLLTKIKNSFNYIVKLCKDYLEAL